MTTDATDPAAGDSPTPKRRRRWRRQMAIVGLLLAAIGLAISYLPRYVVAHLLATELDSRGIEHAGLETLRINPWTGEAWAGPVRFSDDGVDSGEIARVGVDYRYRPLLEQRISIDTIVIEGLSLAVTRDEDGALAVNGVSLAQFVPEAAPADEPATESEWGFGQEDVELVDSRLTFVYAPGRVLTTEVDRLSLDGFRTWTPEEPGRIDIEARLNDIDFSATGTARPFTTNVQLSLTTVVDRVDLTKVSGFTGPLGFERRDGTASANLEHELTLFDTGRIEGSVVGKIAMVDADYLLPETFSLVTRRADIEVDSAIAVDEQARVQISGIVKAALGDSRATVDPNVDVALGPTTLDLEQLELGFGAGKGVAVAARGKTQATAVELQAEPGIDVGAGAATIDMAELRLEISPDGAYRVTDRMIVDVADGRFTGELRISVDDILALLVYLQSLSGKDRTAIDATGLADWQGGGVALPESDVTAASLRIEAQRFNLSSSAGDLTLDLATETRIGGLRVESEDRRIDVEKLESDLAGLELRSGAGLLGIELSGTTRLLDASTESQLGRSVVGSVEAQIDRFDLSSRTGVLELGLTGRTEADRYEGRLFARDERPETGFRIAAVEASLRDTTLKVTAEETAWQVGGDADARSVASNIATRGLGNMSLDGLSIRGASVNQDLEVGADELTLSVLDVTVNRELIDRILARAQADQASSGAEPVEKTPGPGPAAPSGAELVRAMQLALAQRGYETGAVDGRMGPKTRRAIEAYQRDEGLPVDGRATPELLAGLTPPADDSDASAEPESDSPLLSIGRFALIDGAEIRFRDETVAPPVYVDTRIATAEIRDLSMAEPYRRSRLAFDATVNEFTQVDLEGWITPFVPAPLLDLQVNIANLELPPYSPYSARFGGVYFESGQLNTQVAAATQADGALGGTVDVLLDDVKLGPISPEDEARIEEKAGVPIKTAVNLLQDSQGKIELSLPITGTVNEPDVDISSAINKAVGGAFKKIFPPTLIAGAVRKGNKVTPEFLPIGFEPGSAELTDAARAYADELLELLQERPKLSLDFCGHATLPDLQVMFPEEASLFEAVTAMQPPRPAPEPRAADPFEAEPTGRRTEETPPAILPQVELQTETVSALQRLAIERTRAVRRYLVTEKGVEAGRVGECRIQLDSAEGGQPRVDVSI